MAAAANDKSTLDAGFRVGDFLVEPLLQSISPSDDGERTRVEPKVMEVLLCLAEHAGQTVTKRQFMTSVWDETIVSDDALLRCVSELRKIFGDDARSPRYIETIRKRGYRLIAPVSPAPSPAPLPEPPEPLAPPASLPEPPAVSLAAARRRPARRYAWAVAGTALFLLLGTVFLLRLVFDAAPAEPLKALPLTSYPGVESDPNLSPDGSRVAFVWDQEDGGGFDIYIKQIGVETPLRLTDAPADDSSPTWSPDAQFLAFVRTAPGDNGIYVVPSVGGSERRVADLGARAAHGVVWSPDGRTLAFTAERAPHASYCVFVLSMETLEERILTVPPPDHRGDLELAFSPDGRRLAFTRSVVEKVDDIYVVSVDGGELKRLTFEHAEITGLDWTPDGRAILYSSDRAGSAALWQIAVTGGAPAWVPTTSEGSSIHQPSLGRLSRRMAFVQRLQETNVWELALASGDPADTTARRLIASTRWDSNPAVSPDGSRIAFVSNRTGSYEVWTANGDGSNLLQMTHFDGPFTNTPRWSPDGARIAFAARNEGSVDLYVVGMNGAAPRRLTATASNDAAPAWSRDGAWIYFASNRSGSWQVWRIPSRGGAPEQITTGGGYAAAEDPRGEYLFFTRRDQPGIWRMPLGGGPETRVVEDLEPFDWGNWAVVQDGLYFVRRLASGAMLSFYDFHDRSIRPVLPLPAFPKHPALSIAPDERRLLSTRIDRFEGDIWFVDPF